MSTVETSRHAPRTGAVHVADRLMLAMRRCRAPVCVGIDPVVEKLPAALKPGATREEIAAALGKFSERIVEVVAGIVPCVKFQSACFERYGAPGIAALEHSLQKASDVDLEVILDVKRGDIGISASHYAAAAFQEPTTNVDWVTINSYLGADCIGPFLQKTGGAFALVRTTNPGSDAIQALKLKDGQTVAQAVAHMVADIGRLFVGASGFSSLGAVVGATKGPEAEALRTIMPQQLFLVPGYGAQGAGIKDIMPCFRQGGNGAIVTASRSITYAFTDADKDWSDGVRKAANEFADAVGRAVHWR